MTTIKCPFYHEDCFQALGIGSMTRCKLLNAPIAGEECPFYKTEEQVNDTRMAAHQRLKDIGRYDLISSYEYNSKRTW